MNQNGIGLQGVSLAPSFIFGANGELRNSIQMIDENKLIYVAGHNVVVYNINEQSQYFIPGQEGTLGITCLASTPNGGNTSNLFLAICERNQPRATCSIYDLHNHKLKKIFPDPEQKEQAFESDVFLACCLSKNEKNHLITLCGEPDWQVILWHWEQGRALAAYNLVNISVPIDTDFNFACSFNPNQPSIVLVTGPNLYHFMQIRDLSEFSVQYSQCNTGVNQISKNYTGHSWAEDTGRLALINDEGDIFLINYNGEFMRFIEQADKRPFFTGLKTIHSYHRGFIVTGDDEAAQRSFIYAYESDSTDTHEPYKLIQGPIEFYQGNQISSQSTNTIMGAAINRETEHLYFITSQNQFMQVQMSLEGEFMNGKPIVKDVICEFHKQQITGMDICIRKQLIVTVSKDRMIKIWNYATRKLEISMSCNEDLLAVAFHPSGFHLIVALQDKIQWMNIFSNSIQFLKSVTIKNCSEIQFSNGGHIFAAANHNQINIFYFYTGEQPLALQCTTGHTGKVRGIEWFEDDSGFISCGQDGNVYVYDLQFQREQNMRLSDYDFFEKKCRFSGLCLVPGHNYTCFCVGDDGKIWCNKEEPKLIWYDEKNMNLDSKERQQIDSGLAVSQVKMLPSGKALFAGVGEEGRPGAIQVWKIPLDKINEVQGHSKPMERMRISNDNKNLFTAGQDGCLMILDIQDRDPRSALESIQQQGFKDYSNEMLTEKQEMEKIKAQKESLESDLINAKSPTNSGVESKMGTNQQEEKIAKLTEEHKTIQLSSKKEQSRLQAQRTEIEENFERQIKTLNDQQFQEIENKRNEQSQKMLEDAARFQELQAQKDEESNKYEKLIADLVDRDNFEIHNIQKAHNAEMESRKTQISQLKTEIKNTERANKETIKQINEDADQEISDIHDRNTANQNHVQDMALKSRAEYKLTKNKLNDLDTEIAALKRMSDDKNLQLEKQDEILTILNNDVSEKDAEISQKEFQIGEREKKIYHLKKKTQELEKFKFVLDYKIKDLKRDIAPREMEIRRLRTETNEMDRSLKKFNSINANLGFIVDDLRTKQETMQVLIKTNRAAIRNNYIHIQSFKNAIYSVVQNIDNYDTLKLEVNSKLIKFVKHMEQKSATINPDINKEYENQKRFLESSVFALKKQLERETKIHKDDNLAIMKSNISLIKSIAEHRHIVTELETELKKKRNYNKLLEKGFDSAINDSTAQLMFANDSNQNARSTSNLINGSAMGDKKAEELASLRHQKEAQKELIETIKEKIAKAKEENDMLRQAQVDVVQPVI